MTPFRPIRAARPGRVLLLALGLLAAGSEPAWSADVQRLRLRALASSCAACHGTDGHAVPGQALVSLAGLPSDDLLAQLLALRSGQKPATVMHQISRGYSPQQLEALAGWFAAQK